MGQRKIGSPRTRLLKTALTPPNAQDPKDEGWEQGQTIATRSQGLPQLQNNTPKAPNKRTRTWAGEIGTEREGERERERENKR